MDCYNAFMHREMEQLLDIMRLLRDPQRGCPWDLEQNYQTIVPHTLEEARLIYADKL